MAREWIATKANGWLHVGWAIRESVHHGPQHDTEFEVQKVFSYKAAAASLLLEALGVQDADEVTAKLIKKSPDDLLDLDGLLITLADAGLLGIEMQTSEYVGSGMIEDNYDSYSLVMRFDGQTVQFTHVTQFNDENRSVTEYEVPVDAQTLLLSQFNGKTDRKQFFDSIDLFEFKTWHELHVQVREITQK